MNLEHLNTKNLITGQDEALIILGSQVAALGISRHIRRQLSNWNISDLNFIKLSMAINSQEPDAFILKEINECRRLLKEVRENMENTGVSIDLIYQVERIESLLNRIEIIIYVRNPGPDKSRYEVISRFIGRLIRDKLANLRVRDHLKQNLHLLTRKIVERTGDRGDIYIAQNVFERRKLFIAASWAGILTAFTATIKYWIDKKQFPLLVEAYFYFINYAITFLLMQRWHLALSSKQPAYTASALSKKFENFLQSKNLSEIISEVRKIFVSQFIATFGNLLLVIPSVIVIDLIWYALTNSHIMPQHVGQQFLKKHDLLKSFTLFYASLTGIFLWASSVISGWMENWILYRDIPSLIKHNIFLNKLLGKKKNDEFAQKSSTLLAGVAGNLSIAFFLGATSIVGEITGLPLDIRHVTIAAGTITLSMSGMNLTLLSGEVLLRMILSTLIIGLLNFGVSFYCSIRMAALARNVEARYLKIIFKFALKWKKNLKSSE